MKKILILSLVICGMYTTQAQLSLGIKANYSVITAPSAQVELAQLTQPVQVLNLQYLGSQDQFSYGLSLYDENDLLFLNTDILLSHVEHNYQINNPFDDLRRSANSEQFSQKRTNLTVPVAAGLKLHNIKIGGGPVFNYTLSSTDDLTEINNISTNDEKINMGFQFLVGYIIQDRIHIDLKRDISFSDVGHNYRYNDIPVDLGSSPHSFSISVGVFF